MAKHTVHKQEKALALDVRPERGSRRSRLIRAEGKLPGVVYGLGKDPVSVTFSAAEAIAVIHGGSHTIDVTIDGQTEKLLLQDVQYDYLQTTVEHVDFLRIDPNKKVNVRVALDFRGTPVGIDVTKVVRTGLLPVVNTGIAGRVAGTGQVGAGLAAPPAEVFTQALRALAEEATIGP